MRPPKWAAPIPVNSAPELGQALSNRRRELQLSKKQLSGVSGVSPKTIGELERDAGAVPLQVARLKLPPACLVFQEAWGNR
jgi:DNA-binding XRE family transcriptional regulator